jgi:hypothetical protein
MIREFFAITIVAGFAVPSALAQKPDHVSPAQQALENRLRRFDNLPGNGSSHPGQGSNGANGPSFGNPGLGHEIPGLGHGNPGLQISSSRIPESIRERRNEVFSRPFSNGNNHHELWERNKPAFGKPPHAGGGKPALGEGLKENPGLQQAQLVSHGQNRRAYTHADRLLAQRLEQIDRLRDEYLETGDSKLLEQADKLEQLARQQYQFRLDGQEPPSPSPKPLPLVTLPEPEPMTAPAPVPMETP